MRKIAKANNFSPRWYVKYLSSGAKAGKVKISMIMHAPALPRRTLNHYVPGPYGWLGLGVSEVRSIGHVGSTDVSGTHNKNWFTNLKQLYNGGVGEKLGELLAVYIERNPKKSTIQLYSDIGEGRMRQINRFWDAYCR